MNPLELIEMVEMKAHLVVYRDDGTRRDATPEDLRAMGWLHREEIYSRIISFMEMVGLDPHAKHSLLRAFVEDACGSNGIEVWTCSDWEEIRDSYYAALLDVHRD